MLVCLALSSLVAYPIHAARRKVRDVALAALAPHSTDSRKRALEKAAYAMYLPRAGALEWLSVGNRNVAAYFLLIKSFHYINLEFRRSGQKLRWLATMYHTILELDPNWQSVYYLAAVVLTSINGEPQKALDVLDKARERWPQTYRFHFEAGALCLMYPPLWKRAVAYFKAAVEQPDCPAYVKEVYEELASRSTDVEHVDLAMRLLEKRIEKVGVGSPLFFGVLRDYLRLQSLQIVLRARQALADHKQKTGRYPQQIAELAGSALIPADVKPFVRHEHDGFGLRLLYDPATERKVYSEGLLIIETHQAADMLNSALEVYETRLGRRAAGLDKLVEDLRARREQGEEISHVFFQVFGTQLEIPQWPFSFGLPLEPSTGRVVIPPERSMEKLNRKINQRMREIGLQ